MGTVRLFSSHVRWSDKEVDVVRSMYPMTLTIELERLPTKTRPIQAWVKQGGKRGEPLLKSPLRDLESAKAAVMFLIAQSYPDAVIEWALVRP